MANRGGRVIATDTLRILLVLQVPSDGQKREQGRKDNPNINAHQRTLPPAFPVNSSATPTIEAQRLNRLGPRLIEESSEVETTFHSRCDEARAKPKVEGSKAQAPC